jgi:glyoxylase-like metal-dependent hydrolase (beta-lactamase superfamily II)
MTLEGTNTYVVTAPEGAYVIDPGPDDAGHLGRVREAADAVGGIAGVVLTHAHSDHSDGVEALGGPLLWGEASGESEMEALARALAAGSVEGLDDLSPPVGENSSSGGQAGPFTVIATPGHAADHVCFLFGRVCFCGDLILGSGSSIVPPAAGGGSLTAYLSSLEALDALDLELLAPGHGPWITDPAARIAEYTEHRLERERRLVAALEAGNRSRAVLLAKVWDDVPEHLRPAAAIAMQAHLEKLESEGRLEAAELID